MINLKQEIYQALSSDSTLLSLLGGNRIYQIKAPDATEYPRVTFFELMNIASEFADDAEIQSNISFQVSVWTLNSSYLASIGNRIDQIMKGLDFRRNFSMDIYEDETKVFHRPMRFITSREVM